MLATFYIVTMTLTQSLHSPAIVAHLLSLEISEMTENILRSIVWSISEDMTIFLLLKHYIILHIPPITTFKCLPVYCLNLAAMYNVLRPS